MRDSICVVQARAGSSRFPGKVLAELAGRPLLRFMLDRLHASDAPEIVVATSDRSVDDPVVQVAVDAGVAVVRGPEDDVLARYRLALDTYPARAVVRLTADCPLIDGQLVAEAVRSHSESGVDYLSNTLVRTFPDGLDTEVITASTLEAAAAESDDRFEREHVTPFVYRRPERFRLGALSSREPLELHRWTIDWPADLNLIGRLVERVADPVGCGWRDFLAVADEAPGSGNDLRTALAEDLRSASSREWMGLTSDGAEMVAGFRADSFEDPARRVWTVRRDGDVSAWVRVGVEGASGRLDVAAQPATTDVELVGWIETACAVARGQVRTLRAAPRDTRGAALFREAGFVRGPSGDHVRDLHAERGT